ncbi:hypothetical protein BBO99_00007339 [Phytophthora kernoviae]|uniref:acyl-CoA oxidase n=2 Tax=Phytophthora kernoviae TaxID=325452 RepID=A0A3R7J880_9STRA|nr:hypothetical protein BBI17_007291 [Phytophthora kernoviae]RLN76695.1 hypothetical protein BBO99_00007339 [Phytophthora kernoviae]
MELKDLSPLLLTTERINGDIDPTVITDLLRGGKAANDRRKELVEVIQHHPVLSDRDMVYRNHSERYNFGLKKAFHYVKLIQEGDYTDEEQAILLSALGEQLPFDLHRIMFIPTIENQGTDEQRAKWLPLAESYKIIGAYAQTELGHGSNVQGIETIATYDKATQEFIIDSPTLTSRKWWPGGLGKTSTHTIVIARLILDGRDVGVQSFIVQVRSFKDHMPLPGIEIGDIGPKVGFNAIDNANCAFHKVRIPRENMMMRYAKVLPDGTFVQPKSDKLVYLTMVYVRATLIKALGERLAMGTTITARFSAARIQGRKPDKKGEFQVLDYQNQQHALFPLIAIAYASQFAGSIVMNMHDSAVESIKSGSSTFGAKLAELHAISSGLKAWLSDRAGDGVETCRRLCGGHGFLQSSNLAHLFAEIAGANTFEGTVDVLVQQHARYLLKVFASLPSQETATRFLNKSKIYNDKNLRCKAQVPEDFGNLDVLIEIFQVRATRVLTALAQQMKATKRDCNACMILMTRASTAHTELMMLEGFVRTIDTLPVTSIKEKAALANLCSLFGVWLITKSLGDFRQHDYLSSQQADLVCEQVVLLLPIIRKNCVLLADAWDFSDFELNSTIGRYDGDIYRALVKRAADEPLNKTQVPEGYEVYLKPLIHLKMAVELKDLAPLMLKKERANGDIDPIVLTNVLRDGFAANNHRKQLVEMIERHPVLSDRDMMFRNHTERYNFGMKKVAHFVRFIKDQGIVDHDEQDILYAALGEPLCIDVHNSMFIPTLENQGTDEQRAKWLPLAKSYKILGAYAQTELGHGSNVQGIETVATYDKANQEFIVDSPTLTSRKWWPGGLGKTANHAIVHARLFLDGKDVGVQAFLVQIRSMEDHQPLPGIEVGDIGPKVGFNAIDNGYCAFHKVRIPRGNMMMRYAKVLPDGTFVKPKSDKLVYLTMVRVRANLVESFALTMAKSTAITTRFSAARLQGRTPDRKGEFQVLDYQNQQHVLFPFIAISYAAKFAARDMMARHNTAVKIVQSGDADFGAKLAALHAVSSGLKAWLAETVSDGVESCRRLCGGHGFTQSSNLAHTFAEIVGANTFEGTFDVLVQQHARYLLKILAGAKTLDTSEPATQFLSKIMTYADPKLRCKAQTSVDFGDLKLLVEAFEARAGRVLLALASKMKGTNNDGNACMVLMTRVSTAHTELMLMEALMNGITTIPSGKERQATINLCSLLGVWLITKSLGDFRQHDYLSSQQADLVCEQVVLLLPIIRKNCVLLADAWDFSDFELNSTIGRYDGDIYRALVKRAADEPLNKTQVPEGYEVYLKPLIQSGL